MIDFGLTAKQKVKFTVNGFKGLATQTRPSNTETRSHTTQELKAMYIKINKQRKDDFDTTYASRLTARTTGRHAAQSAPMPDWLEPSSLLFDQEFAHIQMRPSINSYPIKTPGT